MESNGKSRSGLLIAGGVLSIIGGILELIAGGIAVGVGIVGIRGFFSFIPEIPWFAEEIVAGGIPAIIIAVGVIILALGAVGLAGGISALNRRSFGLSLAGAICILPTAILGILAVIFVSVSSKEF